MIQQLKLTDLHRHLDGSIRQSTLSEFASQKDIRLPQELHFYKGMGLQDALSRFETTLKVLQGPSAVTRVASEICEDAIHDGVTTLEIRFAPQLHKGACEEAIIDAALEGIDGRAGLILCGLYGEDPKVLENLVHIATKRPGVVGIDLAGGPCALHSFGLTDYSRAFSIARDVGLGRTIHAGEGRPPEEIKQAITCLHAQRIGHGTTLLEDSSVVDLILENNVTIEACPTSNVHTSAITSVASHPIKQWMNLGISTCINTDNTFFSNICASEEYRRVVAALRLSKTDLQLLCENGARAAFIARH